MASRAAGGAGKSTVSQGNGPQGSGPRKSGPRRSGPRKGERQPAETLPVARICVDVPLAHLDRPFDYLVPAQSAEDAVPGCRVRVRFAGQLLDGIVLERVERSEHPGKLAFLERVTSAEPVLSPEIAALSRAVAERYAGTLTDVLRLALPPRHARVEGEKAPEPALPPERPALDGWRRYPRGGSFLEAVRAGRGAHAVWQALPDEDWPARLAETAAMAVAAGRGAVLLVPDHRDVARVHAAAVELLGESGVVALSADLGPAERYRRWLAVRRGAVQAVVGTRATAFAPVSDPGLLVIWDDGDDLHAEPRAPYPHSREVLTQRAHATGASLLIAGYARTSEAQLLVDSGWAHEITAARDTVRTAAPRVSAIGETDFEEARDPAARAARLPTLGHQAAAEALAAGAPVLVQVPRRGYVPSLACGVCRTPARCRHCAGPLAVTGRSEGEPKPPSCRWCGRVETGFRCSACGSPRLRAVVIGAGRTAEELGRAFPGATVRTSGAGEVLSTVPGDASVVIATPGAEPVASGGYGAALLLDPWALLSRADLRATEETLRRWMAAAALVRPASAGGRVVVMAESTLPPVQALIRWDPVWHAATELAARKELGFPPAARMASVEGSPDTLGKLEEELRLPSSAELLGPVPLGDPEAEEPVERLLIRVPRQEGRALAHSLYEAIAARTARKDPDVARVRVDPLELV
jgi:primosomal protein N' (replication factor Y)